MNVGVSGLGNVWEGLESKWGRVDRKYSSYHGGMNCENLEMGGFFAGSGILGYE